MKSKKSGKTIGQKTKRLKPNNNSKLQSIMFWTCFHILREQGLHVGHPLGYIASDIYARYKRHKGFNVLHPQGYDSFGLPAEQYAIQTGQHPKPYHRSQYQSLQKAAR